LLEPALGEVDRLAEAAKLADHFRSGSISLYNTIERVLEKQPGTDRALIVVDQFEELYTLTADEEARRCFLDELLAISSPRAGSIAKVVVTLRGDFVGKALAYRSLSDRLQDAQINLGPMTREELEMVIREPAKKIQLKFESGLINRILDDVGDEPGNLPLLEFVLKELWDKRRGGVLLNETYDALGGLQGAVASKADALFKGLSSAEQKILQRCPCRRCPCRQCPCRQCPCRQCPDRSLQLFWQVRRPCSLPHCGQGLNPHLSRRNHLRRPPYPFLYQMTVAPSSHTDAEYRRRIPPLLSPHGLGQIFPFARERAQITSPKRLSGLLVRPESLLRHSEFALI
jgi:hypothetical protein